MKGMNIIQLNTLHLNVVLLNGDEMPGEVVVGGGEVVPVPPTEPETPDVPVEPKKFILSASVANGVVSATLNGVVVSLPYTANEGDVIVVSVTPNDGYEFNGWADGNTDNPRSITMTADVALSAQCVEVVQPPVGNYIQFEDKAVEAICVANWSSDGIGLTEEDAAAVTTIGNAFYGNETIEYFNEFEYFTGITRLVNPNAGATIKESFYGCKNLKEIRLPSSLTTIYDGSDAYKNGAFYGCSSLVSVGDMSHITRIGRMAFRDCSSFSQEINAPSVEGSIGYYTFYGTAIKKVSNLGNATILEGVSIASVNSPAGAFARCISLEEVRIPATMTSIQKGTFGFCTALKTIICEATTPPSLDANAWYGSNALTAIYVPDASLEAYKTATNWNQYADRIHPLSEIEDYYVSDALLMHLDGINKGNVEGEWQDLVGNNHFHAKADTPMPISLDNGWEFNGVDTMMTCDKSSKVSWSPTFADGTRTMEIVVEFTGTEDKSCCFTMGSAGFAFGRTSNKYILGATGAKAAMVNGNGLAPRKCVFTYVGNGVAYENGVLLSSASSDYWNADWTLGAASNGRYFKGKIHAIRIHNRILSQEEILYNQRIDNKRFNLGLDI